MCSTQDPIRGLQKYIEGSGLASEQELKQFDKEAKAEVDAAVEKAKASPELELKKQRFFACGLDRSVLLYWVSCLLLCITDVCEGDKPKPTGI